MKRVVHECHRDDNSLLLPSIPISEYGVVFNCACDARAFVIVHMDESLMMLRTSEMGDVML